MSLRGPQSKDQLEFYLAGIMHLIETGLPLPEIVPEKQVHRQIACALVKALNEVDALRPRFKVDWKTTIWAAMDAVAQEGVAPKPPLA